MTLHFITHQDRKRMTEYNAAKREDPSDDDDDLPEETEELGVWNEEHHDEDEWLACNAVIVMQLCHSDAVIPFVISLP